MVGHTSGHHGEPAATQAEAQPGISIDHHHPAPAHGYDQATLDPEYPATGIYGLIAEFYPLAPGAARGGPAVAAAGYKRVDAYSPFRVHGLDEAIGAKTILPWLIFGGGLTGGLGGFAMQVFASAYHYKQNIAGKPLISAGRRSCRSRSS